MGEVRLASEKPIKLMDAQTVASIRYEALKKRKTMIMSGYQNKILALFTKLAPRVLTIKVTGWLMKRVSK